MSDTVMTNNILSLVDPLISVVDGRVSRIGKSFPGRPRLLRVKLNSPDLAKSALIKQKVLKNTEFRKVVIRDDKTYAQNLFLKDLRSELQNRINSGESDLTIKYLNGIPRIVQDSPKSSSNDNSDLN